MTATKDDNGKARFDLIPPEPLYKLAQLFGKGAEKYGERNWEEGLSWGRIFGAMQRHAWAFWGGEEFDPQDGQHHLTSVMWCAAVLLEYTETFKKGDNRPDAAREHPESAPKDKWDLLGSFAYDPSIWPKEDVTLRSFDDDPPEKATDTRPTAREVWNAHEVDTTSQVHQWESCDFYSPETSVKDVSEKPIETFTDLANEWGRARQPGISDADLARCWARIWLSDEDPTQRPAEWWFNAIQKMRAEESPVVHYTQFDVPCEPLFPEGILHHLSAQEIWSWMRGLKQQVNVSWAAKDREDIVRGYNELADYLKSNSSVIWPEGLPESIK